MTIGERIREARKQRNMTQKQLAEAAKVATGTIQQYELGKREPRYDILLRLSSALNISVAALCIHETVPTSQLTVEAVMSALDKSEKLVQYLRSLGYEIIDDFIDDDDNLQTLLVDHSKKRLFMIDSSHNTYTVEQSIETYTKFILEECERKGIELPSKPSDGWFTSNE